MELKDKLQEYNEALAEKESLADATKKNNEKLEALKSEIAEMMIDEDVPKMSVNGYCFSLSSKTIYSKKSEADLLAAGLNFFDVLRYNGLGDLIKEQVNQRTLNSTCNNMIEEEGSLPESLASVLNSYDTYDITRRKETNRAIRKAKEAK